MSAVPAWKRLGLKLKGASSDGSPISAASQTTTISAPAAPQHHQQQPNLDGRGQYGAPGFNKRKQFGSGSYPPPDSKRPRWDDSNLTPSRKSVSFSQDTKKAAPKKPKQKKAPKPQTPKKPFDFTPVVEYLRTWRNARDSWKFNKNHQTLLIKHLYNSDAIPSSDMDTFYLYVQDIKGASRNRLVVEAQEIRKKDMEAGSKGFPEGTKAPEDKQKQYEEMLADLLEQKADIKEGGESPTGMGKRRFDELEFVLRRADKEVQQRVVKRMRAETIINELASSDSGDNADMITSASNITASSRIIVPVVNGDTNAANGVDAPKQKAKRRKKLRTADTDSSSDSDSDSSSSDSDSAGSAAGKEDSDSESSSSSSDSDSDSDEEMANANGAGNDESSSSSSSSSESGSGSESEGSVAGAAVAEDGDSGSDGDSESSDSDSE